MLDQYGQASLSIPHVWSPVQGEAANLRCLVLASSEGTLRRCCRSGADLLVGVPIVRIRNTRTLSACGLGRPGRLRLLRLAGLGRWVRYEFVLLGGHVVHLPGVLSILRLLKQINLSDRNCHAGGQTFKDPRSQTRLERALIDDTAAPAIVRSGCCLVALNLPGRRAACAPARRTRSR